MSENNDKYDYFLRFDKEGLFGIEIPEDVYIHLKTTYMDNKLPNNHSLKVKKKGRQ
jgi:hypothetical protein